MTDSLSLGPGAEFDRIRAMLSVWGSTAWGIGDDASVLSVPDGEKLVVSTDSSIENVHFRRGWLSIEEIGYRATVAALSDLAAMAASPIGILIALGLPERCLNDADDLARGIGRAANSCATVILGGDLTRAAELTITVTVLGSAREPLRRSGARAGETVYVTGRLGGPGRALEAFRSGATPDDESRARFATPSPRIREAAWLSEHGATAAIDVSDGIVADFAHLVAASGVDGEVDIARLPRHGHVSAREAAESGEEYELIVTGSDLDCAEFERVHGLPLTAVGRIGSGHSGRISVTSGGHPVAAPAGFSHFSG